MKETKAQRIEREAAELAAYNEAQIASYRDRLMDTLEYALRFQMELSVSDRKFVVRDRNDDLRTVAVLSLDHSEANEDALYDVKYAAENYEMEYRTAERKAFNRKIAMSKLTEEELEALDLA